MDKGKAAKAQAAQGMVSAEEKSEPEPVYDVAFIGGPGMGKSTILNFIHGLNDEGEGPFSTGCGLAGVTEDVRELVCKKKGYSLNLIDTMGWPDPDPARAKEFYDKVIKHAVNRKLHCLVWLVNNERSTHKDLAKKYKIFMREFTQVNCKMLLVVNGKENYSQIRKHIRKLKDARGKAQEQMMANALQLLQDCKLETKIAKDSIIVCPDVDWIAENIETELHDRLQFMDSKYQDVRTFEAITLKYSSDTLTKENLMRDSASRVASLKADLADLESKIFNCRAAAGATGIGAVAGAVAGFFTFGLTFGITASAASASGAAALLLVGYTEHEAAKKQELATEEATAAMKLKTMDAEIAELRREFDEFNALFK